MKHLYLLSLLIFTGLFCLAQQSLTFPYQALVRDVNGEPLANQQITAKITLMADSLNGQMVFEEVHSTATNGFGQLELQIGSENPEGFDTIPWNAGPMFIKLEVDWEGGTAYQEIGTQQLLAVPYAKYAENGAGWIRTPKGPYVLDDYVGIGMAPLDYTQAVKLDVYRDSAAIIRISSNGHGYNYSSLLLRNNEHGWNLGTGGSLFGEAGSFGIRTWTDDYYKNRLTITQDGTTNIHGKYPPSGCYEPDTTAALNVNGGISCDRIYSDRCHNSIYNATFLNGGGTGKGILVKSGSYSDAAICFQAETHAGTFLAKITGSGKIYANQFIENKGSFYSNIGKNPDMSIDELNEFITINKHLPDIDSHDNAENYNPTLGEKDSILLKKIEDLTIYIIQQQEQIKSLHSEIENLKNK